MTIHFDLCAAPNQCEAIEAGAECRRVDRMISSKLLIYQVIVIWHAICLIKVSRRRPGLDVGYECVDAVQISVHKGLRFVYHAWEILMDLANRATRFITLDMPSAETHRVVPDPMGRRVRPGRV